MIVNKLRNTIKKGIPKGRIICVQGESVETFKLDIKTGIKPLDTVSNIDIIKGIFFGSIPAQFWNSILNVDIQMTIEGGKILRGGTETRNFYLKDSSLDKDMRFWVAACLLKYCKRGFSSIMDEELNNANNVFNSYDNDELKIKLSLLM